MAGNFVAVLPIYVIMFLTIDSTEGTSLVSVQLTSTLFDGNTAYEQQQVCFTCTTTSTESNFLTWSSDHYIGQPLQISIYDEPGHQEISPQHPSTVATLISATTNGEVIVIVSQLLMTASMQNLISNVSCQINSDGEMNTIRFRVSPPIVQLSTSLFHVADEYLALEMEQVNFTCTTISRDNFLTWSSDHYIGQLQPLQISFHDTPGHQEVSYQNPSTVATLINATTNGGVMVIVSQLQIIASMQNLISSVSCWINSNGQMSTVQFRIVLELPATTPVSTTSDNFKTTTTNLGREQDENDSTRIVIPAAVGGVSGVVIAAVVCASLLF